MSKHMQTEAATNVNVQGTEKINLLSNMSPIVIIACEVIEL